MTGNGGALLLRQAGRRLGLAGTDMARAQCATIRLKALEDRRGDHPQHQAGALPPVVGLPEQDLFRLVAARLKFPEFARITQHPARAEPPDPGGFPGG